MPEEQTDMTEWVKPNGNTIKTNTNPATVKQAKALGWKGAAQGHDQPHEKGGGNQPNQKQAPKNQESKG